MPRLLCLAALLAASAADEPVCSDSGGSCPAASDVVLLQRGRAGIGRTGGSAALGVEKVGLRGPTTFASSLGCVSSVPFDESSVWESGQSRKWYSCSARAGMTLSTGNDVSVHGAGMCTDAAGTPDYTSIVVDMSSLSDPTGCFAWVSGSCTLDLRQVTRLEFDVDLVDCEDLWAAPLWLTPKTWISPQGLSGEIDFVEACPVPNVATNLGCYSIPGHNCTDGGSGGIWGHGRGLGSSRHVVMTLQETDDLWTGGDLDVHVCSRGNDDCQKVAHYQDYLSNVYPTKGQQNGAPFEFVSDVWNSDGVDGGWAGCRAVKNANTKCKYAITKIQVTGKNGAPAFTRGKCTALNKGNAPAMMAVPSAGVGGAAASASTAQAAPVVK